MTYENPSYPAPPQDDPRSLAAARRFPDEWAVWAHVPGEVGRRRRKLLRARAGEPVQDKGEKR